MTQSESSDQPNPLFKELFNNTRLTAYDLIQSDEIVNQIKNDSSQFTQLLIAHQRAKQIIKELMHITLMPQTFITYSQSIISLDNSKISEQLKKQQSQKNTGKNEVINQIIAEKQKQKAELSTTQIYRALQILTNQYEEFVAFIFQVKEDDNCQKDKIQKQQEEKQEEQIQDDDVIFELVDLKKQDKKQEKVCYQILQKMFELFDQVVPIEETPCSYLVKIILPFSYQKPQQILKFICDKSSKYPKLICKHLYNSSIEELLMHVFQIQNNGNFYTQQKIQLLQIIIEQTFHYTPKQKFIEEYKCQQIQISFKQSNFNEFDELRIQNYLLLLKSLFQKLEDKYQQQKYLPILKDTLNDTSNLNKIKGFFFYHLDFFHINNFVLILNMYLKMDAKCFQLYKLANKRSTDNFGDNQSFYKNQQSSICNYDLKLSSQILSIIQDAINKISVKQKWQSSSLRCSQYYELLYNWLVVTQKTSIITVEFINTCLSKFISYKNNTILHNSIKAIIVNYLPKVKNAFQIITSIECQLIPFIEKYLTERQSQSCFQNQLYHISLAVLSIWQENKLIKVMNATLEEDGSQNNLNQAVKEYAIRIQSLKHTVQKKKLFYQKLICGDPRKIGEYQEEQSSEIIMTSSFKNFMRPAFDNKQQQVKIEKTSKPSRYQIGQQIANLDSQNVNIFNSAISPLLSNNKVPSFTFDFDALPLNSDDSQELSEQQTTPKQQDIKLLQQNLDNFDMKGFKLNKVLDQINYNQEKGLLSVDNYRRDERCKSVQIISDTQNRSEQQQDIGSLKQNSNGPDQHQQCGQCIEDQFKVTTSEVECYNLGIQSANGDSSLKQQISSKLQQNSQQPQNETADSQFVRHYSSYLSYDIDKLCEQVEQA